MATAILANRVKVATATTGTGTVTLGAASSNAFCTFAQAGITDGQTVTYCIEEGTDFEIGRGVYTASGTTLTRATVLLSKIGGTAGTSKMNLAGAATVRIDAAKEDLDVNDFTDIGAAATGDKLWAYDVSASVKGSVLLSALQTLFLAAQSDQEAGTSTTLFVAPGRQQYHVSAAKAWIRWNMTGTPAIAASYNVSSITDNATGNQTVNFTTAFSSANYGVSGMGCRVPGVSDGALYVDGTNTPTTGACRHVCENSSGSDTDQAIVGAAYFGDQ